MRGPPRYDRGWIIIDRGEPLWHTIRRTRPEAWEVWGRTSAPPEGFLADAHARPVRLLIEER